MRPTRRLAVALLAAVALAGCGHATDHAADVERTEATLTANPGCRYGLAGGWFFDWRRVGGTGWTRGPLHDAWYACRGRRRATISDRIAGLAPATVYEFRLGFRQPDGTEATAKARRFTTRPRPGG